MGWAVFVGIAALVAGGLYLYYYLKRKRRQELARVGGSFGLSFSAEDPFGLIDLPFALFTRGDGRGCENVLSGRWHDMDVREVDYWYYEETSGSGSNRSRSYYRFSCVTTEVPAACPHLTIGHETVLTRVGGYLGFQDIELESEEFNREYRVACKDPKFANDILDPRMMQWLIEAKGWAFEVADRYILCYCKRLQPAEVPSLIHALEGFRKRIPPVVWELYPSSAPER